MEGEVLESISKMWDSSLPPGRKVARLYYILRMFCESAKTKAEVLEDAMWNMALDIHVSQLTGPPSPSMVKDLNTLMAQYKSYVYAYSLAEWALIYLEDQFDAVIRGYATGIALLHSLFEKLLAKTSEADAILRIEIKAILDLISELDGKMHQESMNIVEKLLDDIVKKAEALASLRLPPLHVLDQKPGSAHPQGRRF